MNHAANAATEKVQTIVWIIEIVTFIATALIAFAVWRIGKRASKQQEESKRQQKG